MKPVNLHDINDFLKQEAFVLFGISTNKQKFGNAIFKELVEKGMKIYAIHKEIEMQENQKCYKTLDELPQKVTAAIICTKPEKTAVIINQLKEYGITQIWLQQGSATDEVIEKAKQIFSKTISKKCILMYANEKGIHKFHANILRFFRKYPKK